MTLSHTRRGSGPPLVLLHGVGCQYQYWYPVLDRLAAERDVIAVDFPGFGDSPPLPPGTRPTPRALADATRELFDELELDKPHIAGNSLGGWVALELAKDDRAATVTAISPAGFALPKEAKFAMNSLRSTGKSSKLIYNAAPKVLSNPTVRKLAFAQVFAKGERLTTEEAVRSIRNVADSPGWDATLDELERGQFFDGHEVTVPTTFLWGDKERLLIPRDRQASRCLKSVPGSRLIWLTGCGHTPMWDDPPQVADAILEASAQTTSHLPDLTRRARGYFPDMTLRAFCLALLAFAVAAPTAAAAPPPLPSKWPSKRLEIGLADQPGGAAALRRKARPALRYQYLAGGYNTGNGWQTWNENGTFVSMYIAESKKAKQTPVFTYYQVNQSEPGRGSGESDVVETNLRSGSSLKDMFGDLKVFFERARAAGGPVVLHVEPDLWGYIQQSVGGSDDGKDYEVNVSGAGLSELDGLPNTAAGFAQAIVRLRDRYAPNVVLGYHVSIWGTGTDITLQDPSNGEVDRLATRAANFYRSLGANFDVTFGEFDDRDSGFNESINGDGGASWFKKADYTRHARFFRGYSRASGQRIVLWQIPLGNTLMRAMNNKWGHFQDNKVQTVLGGSTSWLRRYRDAGVVAFLFGGGADGTTCACDATNDGKTNPAPINGNKRRSLSADDDGGYWASRTKAYYRRGALSLPR